MLSLLPPLALSGKVYHETRPFSSILPKNPQKHATFASIAPSPIVLHNFAPHFLARPAGEKIVKTIAISPDYDKIFLLCIFLCSQEKERHFISKEKKK